MPAAGSASTTAISSPRMKSIAAWEGNREATCPQDVNCETSSKAKSRSPGGREQAGQDVPHEYA
jgi:hypothetical protein